MKIQSHQIQLSSQHRLQRREEHTSVTLEDGRPVDPASARREPPRPGAQTTRSGPAQRELDLAQYRQPATQAPAPTDVDADGPALDPHTQLLKALVESLSGRRIEVLQVEATAPRAAPAAPSTDPPATAAPRQPTVATVDLTLIREYELSEVSLRANVEIDGQSRDIALRVTMERRYEQSTLSALVREGYLVDPLTLDFGGDSTALSDRRVEFDLNADGSTELIPTLASNSAYLALDHNADGIINDGSELFGARSGDGFGDLSRYDEDGNGFIDAGDAVFSQLSVYRPGDAMQHSLEQMGVAALYLGSVASPYRLTDGADQTLGQIRATGFYLDQNHRAGTLRQIDLAV